MGGDPQEDFEQARIDDGDGEWPLGIVGGAVYLAAAGVLIVWDVADGVIARARGARAVLRRWPVPATLGTLTNEDIDRLPTPGRS